MNRAPKRGHSGFFARRKNQSVTNRESGIALVAVLVFLLVIAAAVALRGGEELGEIHVAAADAEARRIDYVAQAGLQRALWRARDSACQGDFTIPATALGPDSYSATTSGGGTSTAYVLAADQDAWIRSDNTDNTGGGDQHIRFEGGKIEQALYRFDLSTLPAGAQINSATAWFYLEGGKEHPEGPLTVHRINADWTEADATWDTLNGRIDTAVLAVIPAQAAGDVWVNVNLTAQVQAWVNGQPNHGVMLGTTAEGIHSEYKSREDGSTPPRLEVVVGNNTVTPLNIEAVGTLGNGATRTVNRPLVTAYQPTSILIDQPGPEGKDGWVDSTQVFDNFGATTEMTISGGGSPKYFLAQFATESIPAGSRIVSAQLEMYLNWLGSADPAAEFSVHRMTHDWIEGTGDNWWSGDGATFATWDGGFGFWLWNLNHDASPVATTRVNPTFTGFHSWDISPLVQQWVSGASPNYGLVIKGNANAVDAWFRSSDWGTPDERPKLTIEYACACGTACMAPQGSGTVLMVVGDLNNLEPADEAALRYLQAWGYTVEVLDDGPSQSAFNNKFATSDVVYVSESINSTTLGTKLTGAPIGVISADGAMNDKLGIAANDATAVGHTVDVVDTSHYITQVFPAGQLEFKTADSNMATVSGTLAPGAQELARIGGAGSVVVVDTGGSLFGGGTAAGRRALIPVGEANFDWFLNNNGHVLLQRALAWGMGADSAGIANLLMVVVNDANLTTQEEAKQALLQSWGYTVNVIDESDSQGEFNTAVAANDVVFITEDVASGNVGTKLVNAAIGVVTEEDNLSDEFGLADGIAWESGTQLEINDTTHYITSPFTPGLMTVMTASESLAYVTPSLSPDLSRLASSASGYALVALDAGDAHVGGGTAAGRRVQLPWGGDGMDVNSLNSDGLTIFQRALEWGRGLDLAGPVAHWKLDETIGTTAVDSVGGHDGTLSGNPAWTSGTLAGALDFDGSGDMVDAGQILEAGTPQITATAWIYKRDNGDDRIIAKSTGTNIPDHIFSLGIYLADIRVRLRTTDNGGSSNYDGGAIPLNSWTHVAFTYDGAQIRIYRDGTETASYSVTGNVIASTQPVVIGNVNLSDDRYWNGLLDDVRLYDRALSAGEIADLAMPPPSLPIAHWMLDETSGTTAVDSAGGNNGTLNNGASWTTGQIDGGISLDGNNDHITAGSFDVTGSGLTLMGWFNADALPSTTDPRIVSKASTTAEADTWWQLSILTTGTDANIRLRTKAGGTTATLIDSSTNLNPGEWYFAVGTYDAATGTMKLYLNGIEVASRSHPTGGAVSTNVSIPVAIGANGSPEQFFDGVLDDVRVYNSALTAAEVSAMYAAGGGGGGAPTIFEVRVASSSDDAEERVSNGSVNLTSSDLELISDGSNAQLVGMRFTNVTVPAGSTISNAYVQFQVDETNTGGTSVNIQGQAIDDAPTFTTSGSNISSRAQTSASVAWSPVAWSTVGAAGPDQQTPNIATVIQEIVDRPGWVSGNDIVVIITGSGERTAESYNGVSTAAPLLHIEYLP